MTSLESITQGNPWIISPPSVQQSTTNLNQSPKLPAQRPPPLAFPRFYLGFSIERQLIFFKVIQFSLVFYTKDNLVRETHHCYFMLDLVRCKINLVVFKMKTGALYSISSVFHIHISKVVYGLQSLYIYHVNNETFRESKFPEKLLVGIY